MVIDEVYEDDEDDDDDNNIEGMSWGFLVLIVYDYNVLEHGRRDYEARNQNGRLMTSQLHDDFAIEDMMLHRRIGLESEPGRC